MVLQFETDPFRVAELLARAQSRRPHAPVAPDPRPRPLFPEKSRDEEMIARCAAVANFFENLVREREEAVISSTAAPTERSNAAKEVTRVKNQPRSKRTVRDAVVDADMARKKAYIDSGFLSVADVAMKLGVSRTVVRELCYAKVLAYFQASPNAVIRIPRLAVDQYIAARLRGGIA